MSLTTDDYNFILKSLDTVTVKGFQASLKMGEVFLKIQNELKELANVKAGAKKPNGSGPDGPDKEVVPE